VLTFLRRRKEKKEIRTIVPEKKKKTKKDAVQAKGTRKGNAKNA